MHISIYIGILMAGIIALLFWFDGYRTLKTVYLILRTQPFERTVTNGANILVLGDSTGYGTGVYNSKESIAGRIGSEYPNYTINNNSKNGRTIGDLLEIINKTPNNNELILLQIGGNDILQRRDITVVEKELNELLSSLKGKTNSLIMMSTGNVGASAFNNEQAQTFEKLSRRYRDMFIRVTAENNVTYVDLFVEPENDLFIIEPETYFSIDGLHPSAAGYNLWFEKLKPHLEKLK